MTLRTFLALAPVLDHPGVRAGSALPGPDGRAGPAIAWSRQDADRLVAGGARIQLQLPGADPSAPVGARQAARLLRSLFDRSSEVETLVSDVRQAGEGLGYVELRRGYRTVGTQQPRHQVILLSYRWDGGAWALTELRVSD